MTAAGAIRASVDVLTLAVADLPRAVAFYRDGLGLPSAGIVGEEFVGDEENAGGAAAMFRLDGGLILMLYPDLAKDAGIPPGEPGRRRRDPRPRRGRRWGRHRAAAGATVGHLLRLLPRSRRPPLGDHLESTDAPRRSELTPITVLLHVRTCAGPVLVLDAAS
jgi:catechol 2,3-dioxygenase-like lactoylglutathione lyase family enzyme